MKRAAIRAGQCMLVAFVLALLLAGLIRGTTLLKQFGRHQGWWDAPPSLDAWDPKERIEAAEEAARRYGGKQ